MTPGDLIHRYLSGEAGRGEVAELDRLLAGDPQLRTRFIDEAGTDAALREIALQRVAGGAAVDRVVAPRFRPVPWAAAAAASRAAS